MARGKFGAFDGVPVTSLFTTITGTDRDAAEILKRDEDVLVLGLARGGKVTFKPTDLTDDGEPLVYQRQQVARIGRHVILRRDDAVKLYDEVVAFIAKRLAESGGQQTIDSALEED